MAIVDELNVEFNLKLFKWWKTLNGPQLYIKNRLVINY